MKQKNYDDIFYKCEGCGATMKKKPVGPENRLRCAICGYEAPKSGYKHTCWKAIYAFILMALGVIGLVVLVAAIGMKYFPPY